MTRLCNNAVYNFLKIRAVPVYRIKVGIRDSILKLCMRVSIDNSRRRLKAIAEICTNVFES